MRISSCVRCQRFFPLVFLSALLTAYFHIQVTLPDVARDIRPHLPRAPCPGAASALTIPIKISMDTKVFPDRGESGFQG